MMNDIREENKNVIGLKVLHGLMTSKLLQGLARVSKVGLENMEDEFFQTLTLDRQACNHLLFQSHIDLRTVYWDFRDRLTFQNETTRLHQFHLKADWLVTCLKLGLFISYAEYEATYADKVTNRIPVFSELTLDKLIEHEGDLWAAVAGLYIVGTSSNDLISFTIPPEERDSAGFSAFDPEAKEPVPRWCCAIGWEPALEDAPGSSLPLDRQELLGHRYGGTGYLGVSGNWASGKVADFVAWLTDTAPEHFYEQGYPRKPVSKDPVGYVYTSRGGLIDIGHARGLADRTRHISIQMLKHLKTGEDFPIYNEKGNRTIRLLKQVPVEDHYLAALLGARIAYETSIWHEIVTFFTWEQYSAFSPEDNYSNILGCYAGFKALFDPKNDYNMAINVALAHILLRLLYHPKNVTQRAVAYVQDYWFKTNTDLDVEEMPKTFQGYSPRLRTLPLRRKVQLELLRRHFNATQVVSPWLITDVDVPGRESTRNFLRKRCGHPIEPLNISVPEKDKAGMPLKDYYRMEIEVDTGIIPSGYIEGLPYPITSNDFPELIERMKNVVKKKYGDGSDSPY